MLTTSTRESRTLRLQELSSLARGIRHRIGPNKSGDRLWQKEMLSFYAQFIKEGNLCFDVGANTGKIAEIFLLLGARVVCLEPQKNCLRQLKKVVGKNPNATIIGEAVGERKGEGVLMICDSASTIATMSEEWQQHSRFSRDYKWSKSQPVTVTTLDSLVDEYGLPAFCKIDVEGFEESVLKGLTKPIPVLSFEFAKEFPAKTVNCLQYLASINYSEFNCTFGDTNQFMSSQWLKPEQVSQRIDSFSDETLWGNIYARTRS